MEELFGYIADWIGLDLRKMSMPRIIFVVTLYSMLGLILLIGGIYTLFMHSEDGVAIVGGAFCAFVGAGFLVRIITNVIAVMRHGRI